MSPEDKHDLANLLRMALILPTLSVECPQCSAAPGHYCMTGNRRSVHSERMEAYCESVGIREETAIP